MASVRILKKEIDNLLEEVMADCYLALYFHPQSKDAVVAIMQDTVALRNEAYEKANNPIEKHNPSLVRKHYAQLRQDIADKVDELFDRLSGVASQAHDAE